MTEEEKLTRDQYDELERCLDEIVRAEENGTEGKHAILVGTLSKFGFRVGSTNEALKMAYSLLDRGWKNE